MVADHVARSGVERNELIGTCIRWYRRQIGDAANIQRDSVDLGVAEE